MQLLLLEGLKSSFLSSAASRGLRADMVSKEALTRFEADNCIWSLQYDISYHKNLCHVILEPTDLVNPRYKITAATELRKVFTSRWIQSLNFRGELEDELKDLFKNEFYEILLSSVHEDVKSTLKQVVHDVYKETWVEVWFLEELMNRVQCSDRIFLELLTNATSNYGNSEHDRDRYREVFLKLVSLFASLMKKYLSSLPSHLVELKLLLKLYPSFAYENITRHLGEDLRLFVEKLEDFVLEHPADDSGEQLKDLLAAKKQVFEFWSNMQSDESRFIEDHSVHLFRTSVDFLKSVPVTKEHDEAFVACVEFLKVLLIFHWEKMDFTSDEFEELFRCLVRSCLRSAAMDEAEFCTKEPRKYANYVLDRGVFDIGDYKSSSARSNVLYNFVTYLVNLRECIHVAVSRCVPNFLERCGFQNSDNILERDFYWNLVNSLNQDGDDDSSDNRTDLAKFPMKLVDKFREALNLLFSDEVTHPLLQCDALKIVILQRKQFEPEELNRILGALVDLLSSPWPAVTYFAAFAIGRILWCKNMDYTKPLINDEVLLKEFPKLFGNVAKILNSEGGKGHAFVIGALKEALTNLNVKVNPIPQDLMTFLKEQILATSEDADENFAVHLFDCVGVLASTCIRESKEKGGKMADDFEEFFLNAFEEVMSKKHKNHVPLLGYVVVSTFMSRHESSSPALKRIMHGILSSELWLESERLSFLVFDVQLLASKSPEIFARDFLESVLSICYGLLTAQPVAFGALQIFVATLESSDGSRSLEPHLADVFARLMDSFKINKEVSFLKGLVVFVCCAVVKFGAGKVLDSMKVASEGFFASFVTEAVLPVAKYTEFVTDRRITIEGLSLLLEHFAQMAVTDGDVMKLWAQLILSLADVLHGFEVKKLIGDRESDCYSRSFHRPLSYDLDLETSACSEENRFESRALSKLEILLRKHPQLAQSSTFSDQKFDFKVRKKLKTILRKNNFPSFPHLTYPEDPEDDDDDDDDDDESN